MQRFDLVPGRSCENCTYCCKVLTIAEFKKPRGVVCTHCDWGKGCTAYAQRPASCVTFYCSYMLDANLGEEWKPTTSHLTLSYRPEADVVLVYLDPDDVDAWKREPYYSTIKTFAATRNRGYLLLLHDKGMIALAGSDEFDLGMMGDNHVIVRDEQPGPEGKKVRIYLAEKDVARR